MGIKQEGTMFKDFKPGKLVFVWGNKGHGKTSILTKFALQFRREYNDTFLYYCESEIDAKRMQGFKKLSYPKHLVFSDYDIIDFFPDFKSYKISGKFIGLANSKIKKMLFLPPYSFLALDEGQKYFDSHEKIERFKSQYYEEMRHHKLTCVVALTRVMLIHKNLRDIGDLFIEVQEIKVTKDKFGNVTNVQWYVLEFDCAGDVERYLSSNDKSVGRFAVYEEDDIFDNYDTHEHSDDFYEGMEERDFDLFETKEELAKEFDIKKSWEKEQEEIC